MKLRSESQKYRFNEITGSFRGVNATYTLHWNIVPWIGLMRWGKSEGVQLLKTAEDAV
jgi:Signal peptidase subunit